MQLNLLMKHKMFMDDAVFQPGKKLLGAIAVYNKGTAEHKCISGNFMFDFAK